MDNLQGSPLAGELRSNKMQELKELQQLLEQNIVTDAKFAEQKSLVLNSLRKLIHWLLSTVLNKNHILFTYMLFCYLCVY